MRRNSRRSRDAIPAYALLAVAALTLFAGCSGRTTGASQITSQPDGSYTAKLSGIGSCDKGSPTTPCTGYMRWRVVGTKAWTNGPTITVGRTVKNLRRSEIAKGLSPHTTYEFQACGKEFSDTSVKCVGPDGTPSTSQQFVTVKSAGKNGQATAAAPSSTQTTPSGSSGVGGGGGGTSPLVPIAIAVAAGALVLGGTWWASRRFHWSQAGGPGGAAPEDLTDVREPRAATGPAPGREGKEPDVGGATGADPDRTEPTRKLPTQPTTSESPERHSGGGAGRRSSRTPIAVAVGAGAALLGGAWLAAKRRFR